MENRDILELAKTGVESRFIVCVPRLDRVVLRLGNA